MFCAVVSVGCGGGGGSDNDSADPEQTESLTDDAEDYDPNAEGRGTSGAVEINLSKLTDDYIAKDGETLTGTLEWPYKISVADGATVTLRDVTIEAYTWMLSPWAGINCEGDATLILEGTNYVQNSYQKAA